MEAIMMPVVVLGITGILMGLFLAYASKKFEVEVDPKVEAILAILPGVNCGACGYPGCSGYASGVALEGAKMTLCAPGGPKVVQKIGDIMGVAVEVPVKKKPHYRLGALVGPAWSVMRRIHRACTRTLVPSSAAAETLMAHGITNTHLWGRGVDHELFHPRARDAALHHRWGQGKTVVGYVGRLAPEKNLEALTYLATDSRYQLVLVGDGPQRAALQRRYPTAIFTGPLTGVELATAYATMDVVVHPGPNETFCQTLQEAHASGTPTVAVAAGGPIDLIKPGVNGYLVGPENLAAELPDAVAAAQHLRGARATVAGRGWDRLPGT